jgi:hypothetical protein
VDQFIHWVPTITTVVIVIATAAVADSNIRRHEGVISDLAERLRDAETDVARLLDKAAMAPTRSRK